MTTLPSKAKIVIIGGGQASCQVATSLRQKKFTGDITILSSESYFPYQRPPLSKKYLSGELAAERLYLKPEKFYEEQNINILKKEFVGSSFSAPFRRLSANLFAQTAVYLLSSK